MADELLSAKGSGTDTGGQIASLRGEVVLSELEALRPNAPVPAQGLRREGVRRALRRLHVESHFFGDPVEGRNFLALCPDIFVHKLGSEGRAGYVIWDLCLGL